MPIDIKIIFLIILFPIILFILIIIQSKKAYNTNKLLQMKNNFTINNQGIHTVSDAGNVHINFDMIFKIRESKNAALIIPKYIFKNYDNENTLRTILKNNVDSNIYKLKK